MGLEVHVQLDTVTKVFCACANRFGDPPNTNVCPVCLGLPGSLPVLNDRAVEQALLSVAALDCDVAPSSIFARKNYFYPDLPKGYQISQYERPLGVGGNIPIEVGGQRGAVPLVRVHLEEDAGKSLHDETRRGGDTRLDLNRCGTPLLEIVTEPAIRRPEEAAACLESLRRLVRWLGVSDGDMSRASLRCDANVSVRRAGETALGTKTEVKNLNSIRAVERAIAREAERQIALLASGGRVEAATLLWDEGAGQVRPMRSKEDAPDYRYFPEPDLPPLVVERERVARVRAALPELPFARRDRLQAEYGIPSYDAGVLTESREIADFYEEVARACGDGKLASHWTMGEVLRVMNEEGVGVGGIGVTAAGLAELLGILRDGRLSVSAAKTVLAKMRETRRPAGDIVRAEGLTQVSDTSALAPLVDDVIARHPAQVAQVRAGEEKVLGFLVGQLMKSSGGKANPKLAREILARRIGEGAS
ncbi:MAG: Asp-tRNA(Asn)/Glu-tRNA(Gln) amidotransferase subunit GatB [bacterium]